MITEADYNTWTFEQIKPYMELVLKAFGTHRMMYGSDWPVCLVAGNYDRVKQVVTQFVTDLSIEDQHLIMGQNSINFYSL
jgi:L-fuconolactonase